MFVVIAERICMVYYIGNEYHALGCNDGQICNEETRSCEIVSDSNEEYS